MSQPAPEGPLTCYRYGCVFHAGTPPATDGPHELCNVKGACGILDLQATSVVSIICLVITACLIWSPLLRGGHVPRIPTALIGLMYIAAIVYTYIGALDIENSLSPYFHKHPKFPILTEFLARCAILVLIIVSLGLVASTESLQSRRGYPPLAMAILFASQLAYLGWDLFVFAYGDDIIKIKVWRRFIIGDMIGVAASALIFWMALEIPDAGPGMQQTLSLGAGIGLAFYGVWAILGPRLTNDRALKLDGGVAGFAKMVCGKLRAGTYR
jgi:hypothetical protein